MRALMTIRTWVVSTEGGLPHVIRIEDIVLKGDNNVLLRFVCGEFVPLWSIASHAANFLLSHREYLHNVLGPQNLEEEYGDDLMQLMWRAYEIRSDEDRPEIVYRFRRIHEDEGYVGEEIGTVQEGEVQYRWLQGDELPDVTIELHFAAIDDEHATTAISAFGQSVMLMACNTITLADDAVMLREGGED